ncbi:MAG TPA: GAF domain-containing SpoIIE family protein phosphatase [Streptosporangiaceae bacterium]|jgi:GAF domain-containing protein|nr:GAF domain-containing SpoIIE family protein phosphatase [Streptosporangiaceae bacterium]
MSPAYVAGKPFPVFVDLTARAAFRSQLSAMLRNGGTTSFNSVIVASRQRLRTRVMLSRLNPPSEARPLVAAAILPPDTGQAARDAAQAHAPGGHGAAPQTADEQGLPAGQPGGWKADDGLVPAARHADLLSRVTRLLLEEQSLSEPVTLYRVARLLQANAADWVIIDLAGEDGVTRAVVAGPENAPSSVLTAEQAPPATPLHAEVLDTGKAALHPVILDENALGATADGRPVLAVIGAGCVLSVPLRTDGATAGVMTLVRPPEEPTFTLSDLRLFEEIGEQLALTLITRRRYHRRSGTAAALQASLLPQVTVRIPGLDWAAAYRPGSPDVEVGGDFYDVFESPGGWGVALGDVCGKGEEAAAVTAMVRHGIRLLSLWDDQPSAVLAKVNTAMMTQQQTSRFVTAVAAHLSWSADVLRVELASAGHPGAAVLRADGAISFTSGGGNPLGLFGDGETRTEQLSLSPGDTLLFYSDGVTEMRAADGTLYGTARLACPHPEPRLAGRERRQSDRGRHQRLRPRRDPPRRRRDPRHPRRERPQLTRRRTR